ncbi:hypothetical protein DL765_006210 [Monosporascus sp. GIB2]|nr:hypothetical protein DL765_006210 [Monosporascus sp. GIB2]
MSVEKNASFSAEHQGTDIRHFGTVVDWRSTVHEELVRRAREEIDSPAHKRLPGPLRVRLKALTCDDWATVAQQWQDSYVVFTSSFVPGRTVWKGIDTHHYDSLIEILQKWQLAGAYTDEENTLLALLKDLNEHGGLGFQGVISSPNFGAYKPNPQTYLGAVCALGFGPHKAAMVAAHLYDPGGARANGLRIIYVERAREEAWVSEETLIRRPEAGSTNG